MDLSLFFFADESATGDDDGYKLLLESAKFADTHGFSAIWTPERHFDTFEGRYPNPAVTGAAIAATTEKVGIRAGSVAAPLHNPIRIAEEWSVVDNLSNGRVGVSFASGWHAADFVLSPDTYNDRRQVMVDAVQQVQTLWSGGEITLPDGTGQPRPVQLFPKPVQDQLPIWVTSSGSPETFKVAGRLGAGVLTYMLGQTDETLAANIANYRDAFQGAQGPDRKGHVTVMLHTFLDSDRDRALKQISEPFHRYLRRSADLIAKTSGLLPQGLELDQLPDSAVDALISRAAKRYTKTSSLFGTVEDGNDVVARLALAGVDEVACLIDFGVGVDDVLESLEFLDELRVRVAGV